MNRWQYSLSKYLPFCLSIYLSIQASSSEATTEKDPFNIFGRTPRLDRPLCDFVSTTKAEALLLILSFAMRHSLSGVAIVDLLQLINVLFGINVLSSSKYLFQKVFGKITNMLNFHFYCPSCNSYIGIVSSRDTVDCPQCTNKCNTKDLKENNFFITVPLAPQMKCILEQLDDTMLNYRKNRSNNGSISDILDGEMYRELSSPGHILHDDRNFSYIFNTDGSPVYNSSPYSIWPIHVLLNELPPRERGKNMALAALWFGKGHPKMCSYMKYFVEDAKNLSERGVDWIERSCNWVTSKIIGVCCVVDAVARPLLQNTTQFNGYFGCSWCLHPGKRVSGQVKYPLSDVDHPERKEKNMLRDMKRALDEGSSFKGVKGPSPLINLPHFNIVWGFIPDYMHSVLLGVSRQLTELWLCSVGCSFYLGDPTNITKIDDKLLQIHPPTNMHRLPRSIKERKYWKASEWRNWLLFYSLPCLNGILPSRFLKHFSKLVQAIFLLLKSNIYPQELNDADVLMLEFVWGVQDLYGEEHMTSNVHTLLHLAKSVKLWGPLWAHSAFVFESANGEILKLVQGTRGAATQIIDKFILRNTLLVFSRIHTIRNDILNFCQNLTSCPRLKEAEEFNCTTVLGEGRFHKLNCEERGLLQTLGQVDSVTIYKRAICHGLRLDSPDYVRCKKTNNSVVQLENNTFGEINQIFTHNNEVYFLVKLYQCLSKVASTSHITKIKFTNRKRVVSPNDITAKCILINFTDELYVCLFPNCLERD